MVIIHPAPGYGRLMQGEESAKLPGLKSVVLTPTVYEKLGNIFAFFESQFSNLCRMVGSVPTELGLKSQAKVSPL